MLFSRMCTKESGFLFRMVAESARNQPENNLKFARNFAKINVKQILTNPDPITLDKDSKASHGVG